MTNERDSDKREARAAAVVGDERNGRNESPQAGGTLPGMVLVPREALERYMEYYLADECCDGNESKYAQALKDALAAAPAQPATTPSDGEVIGRVGYPRGLAAVAAKHLHAQPASPTSAPHAEVRKRFTALFSDPQYDDHTGGYFRKLAAQPAAPTSAPEVEEALAILDSMQHPTDNRWTVVITDREMNILRNAIRSSPVGAPPQPVAVTKSGIVLTHGPNDKREPGRIHEELHAPCGCAFHERPAPHWHPCLIHTGADQDEFRRALVAAHLRDREKGLTVEFHCVGVGAECGKPLTAATIYRCGDCDQTYCLPCLKKHFAAHAAPVGAPASGEVEGLLREARERAWHLDSCASFRGYVACTCGRSEFLARIDAALRRAAQPQQTKPVTALEAEAEALLRRYYANATGSRDGDEYKRIAWDAINTLARAAGQKPVNP